MTKRMLAMLLAVVMIMGLLPMNVFAGTAEDRTKYTPLTKHEEGVHVCEHCIAAGKTEAEATVTWTPWGEGKTTLPNTDGHYYLTKDLNVTAATIESGHVVLCLNGMTVTANGASGNSADRFYNVKKSGSLTILDCTATGTGASYTAGEMTGASNMGIWTSNTSGDKSTGTINVYDGIFQKNVGKVSAAVFMIQGSAKLYIYGGRYAENEAVNTASSRKGGGVINAAAAANYVYMENAVFYKNKADYGAVLYHSASSTSAAPNTVKVLNCVFDSNEALQTTGGALCFNAAPSVQIEGSTFTGNKTKTAGGVIRCTGAGKITIKNSTITGNEGADGAGVIYTAGPLTLDGVTIKQNITKGSTAANGLGAVSLMGTGTQTLTVKGNTVITDNTDGAATPANRNVYMADASTKIVVDGLAATAKISVAGAKGTVLTDVLTDADTVKAYFAADDTDLVVGVQDGKLVITEKSVVPQPPAPPVSTHTHCVCGDLTCTKTDNGHGQVTFEPWGEGKTKLPTSGYYYLTKNLNVTNADVTSGQVVVCLHGQTVTANATAGDAADRFYTLKNAGSVIITDCTATGEGDTYTAGTMTGGTASGFMFNKDNATGSLTIYDGIFTDNSRGSAGGVICVQGKGKLNIYGGLFSDNRCVDSTGGVIYLSSANNPAHIENAVFKGNSSASSGGVLYNNKAAVTLKNVTMTGNTGVGAGVIVSLGAITYEDVTITGNTTIPGSSNYGALHHYNSSSTATVTLKGDTVITGNYYGDPAEGVERNLWLRNHSYKVIVNDLTANAKIGLSCDSGKVTATNGNQYITSNLGDFDPLPYFTCDNAKYILKVVDAGSTTGKRMVFADKPVTPDHPHKLCNDTACAEHVDIDFRNWTTANSLPTSGNINLQTDVTLTAAVAVEGNLNICLNGHTITVNKADTRAFALDNGDVLSITDCQGTGKITGGSRTYGGAISVHRGSTLNLFAGAITGNTALTEEGGALYVVGGNDQYPKGAIVNMYGGEISNNSARMGSAVRLTNPSGAGTAAQFNMYGGTITGNKNTGTNSNHYAAVSGDNAIINLMGGEITGNESATYGAVYVTAKTQLTLGGDIKILNNKVNGKVANLYLAGNAKFAVNNLSADAKVAVTAATYDRFISTETTTDYTKNFISDSAYRTITYKDKALYLGNSTEHQHCVCTGTAASGCDHKSMVWTAWESNNSLPLKNGNYYLTEDVVLKDVQWIKNLQVNLCLNGHTITAAKDKRILSTQETTVLSITDCAGNGKITGGSSNFGGAIGVQAGSTLNLFGGIITGNKSVDKSSGQGGAIYLQATNSGRPGGVLNMYGGTITGNEAENGGAIYARNKSKINIFGGTISGNKSAAYGGAIYACEGIATDIQNATFEGNHAVSGGGAVYVTGANSVLNVQKTTFKDNTIDGYAGGALRVQSTGTKITIAGSTFTGSKAQVGAGIYAGAKTTLNVDDSYFTGNEAERGACIYSQRATTTVGKVTMENNTTTSRAAGIYVGAGELTIDGAVIKNNSGGSGTAITTGSDTDSNTKEIFYPTVNFISGTISGNKGNSGVILLQSKTQFNMKGGTISGNSTSYAGGVYVSTNATFTMTGGSITGNTTKNNGGAIYALRSTVNLRGGSISGNKATKMGGGVFLSGSKLYLSATTISGNKTDTGTGGGGIATGVATASGVKYAPYIKMTGGSITGNYGRHGGAVLLQGNSNTVFDMSGGKITKNEGKVDGGAIYVSTHTTLNMSGGQISDNYCTGRAGAIMHQNSKGNYTGGEIFGNSTKSSGGTFLINGATCVIKMNGIKIHDSESGGSGGTICHQGKGKLYMENVEIYNSKAFGSAGAIYVSNNTVFEATNCLIRDSKSMKTGGAMFLGNNTFIVLDGVTFSKNNAETDGGAIYSRSGNAVMKNMTFTDNKCTGNGGAVNLYRPALQGVSGNGNYKVGNVLENTKFSGNQAMGKGGAIHVDGGSKCVLDSVTMENNIAAMEGGAVWSAGDMDMNSVVATGNTSSVSGYTVYLADSLFDGHSYFSGMNRLGGDLIVKDNQGGDMYMGEKTTASVLENGFGEKTEIHVTLASGVLTNKLYGAYHYEGGDQVYVVTYGDRSITEPEYDETLAADAKAAAKAQGSDAVLYVGVGVFALAIAAVVVALVLKKKKAPVAQQAEE